jgi:hypothetical protein
MLSECISGSRGRTCAHLDLLFHTRGYRSFASRHAKAPDAHQPPRPCPWAHRQLGSRERQPQAMILRLARQGVNGAHESAPADGSLKSLGQGVSCVRQNTARSGYATRPLARNLQRPR